ncbi:glycosyltransferase family 2 protein [Flavobacterium sp.]|uniref:glycosyltransferase family 2 protein n=1 Tax=Flavobacterium sp. TaxID=239 RepID=UPI00286E08A5|nr:glycosyltransferase family 2 protein [Flavobacterium sp.]
METPEISVIMPVFNASKYLKEAIESILNQNLNNFEFIILNDNSTDNSLEIIKEFQLIDQRIILIDKKENCGPSKIRNEGIELAKAEFIAFMDADDVAISTRFEKQIAVLKNNDNIGLCGSWFKLFGDNIEDQIIKHYEYHDELKVNFLLECYIGNPTVMLKKSLLKDLRFKNEFRVMGDYELWSRLIQSTEFYNIQEVLVNYRWHQSNITITTNVNRKEIHLLIRTNQLSEFGINLNSPNLDCYFLSLEYSERQTPEKIKTIIDCGKLLIKKNLELKIFNQFVLEKKINETICKLIVKAKNNNLNFLFYVLKFEFYFFNELKFKHKLKVILKSIFLR